MIRIAIVGGGVAGLASAYLLSGKAEITLYEQGSKLGGHANTQIAKINGQEIETDTGFMVYNPDQYPNFIALLKRLEVESVDTKMTYSVEIPGEVAYMSQFPVGIFADLKNVFRPRYLLFLFEILRFKKVSRELLASNLVNRETSLSDYLLENKFSQDLYNWFLMPLLAAIWSCPDKKQIANFPAHSILVFLNNHKLLNNMQPTWKTIVGGSQKYVNKIEEYILAGGAKIFKSTPVESVLRTEGGVSVTSSQGTFEYDYVVMATHADITSQIIKDKSPEESAALACFSYSDNTTVLHSDPSFLPANSRTNAAWNYSVYKNNDQDGKIVFTYNMNTLQHIDKCNPVLVTLNSPIEIKEELIHGSFNYQHPIYNLKAIEGQALIKGLQAKNKILYAGAHLGYGFHEDGVVSAIEALKHIDVSAPWQ